METSRAFLPIKGLFRNLIMRRSMSTEIESPPDFRAAIARVHMREVLRYIEDHVKHGGKVAWKIKVYDDDRYLKNKKYREEYGLKGKWNRRWERFVDDEDNYIELFNQCCEDALYFVGDSRSKDFNTWKTSWCEGLEGLEKSDYVIWQGGRGGWLELFEFEGREVDPDDLFPCDIGDDVAIFEEMDPAYYLRLKTFCESLDGIDPSDCFNHQLAFQRSRMEEEWEEEKKEKKEKGEAA